MELSAVVLAGGRSRRMGRDKALIEVGDEPLLQQVCEVAAALTSKVWVVTPYGDRYGAILPAGCEIVDEVPLSGEAQPHGPLVGLMQGMAQVETDWVLALACDLPCLHVEAVQGWIEQLKGVESEAIALLPRHPGGWWESLCGFYRRSGFLSMEVYVAGGGRSFQGWLEQQEVAQLQVDEPEILFNCNTPEDLEALGDRASLRQRRLSQQRRSGG